MVDVLLQNLTVDRHYFRSQPAVLKETMDPDMTSDQGAMARDGTPNPQPRAKGGGKKGKKPKHKPDQDVPPGAASGGEAASTSLTQTSNPKQPGDKPVTAKKQKAERKGEGQGEGEGQAQGDATPQKSKAELKAERRAIQVIKRKKRERKKKRAVCTNNIATKLLMLNRMLFIDFRILMLLQTMFVLVSETVIEITAE